MNSWKTRIRSMLSGAYRYSGAMRLHEAAAAALGQRFMTILLFHRVTDLIPEDCLTVSTGRFDRICRLLKERFHVVPVGEIFRIVRAGEPMPRRTLAITFDDCYGDNLTAARTLARYGLPATFFIPTSFVGTERVFDWDRHLPKMPNLTWDEVREIASLGFEIGSHTVNHANLGTVEPEQARLEIAGSKAILEERLGQPVRWFAYPFGGRHHFRPEYLPLIEKAGYEGTLSGYNAFVTPRSDPRILPREAVPYFHSMLHLEMHLSGCLHWWYALRGRADEHLNADPWTHATNPASPAPAELCAPANH